MAKKPETTFKERVLRDLKTLSSCKYIKIQQRSRRGDPDIFGSTVGLMTVIELKKDEHEDPDPLQKVELQAWADSNALSMVCYPENWSVSFEYLKKIVSIRLQALFPQPELKPNQH